MSNVAETPGADQFRPASEEVLNTATHAAGLLLSLGAAAMIFASRQNLSASEAVACAIYAGSLILVYLVSTLSHAVQEPRRKHAFRVLDQGVIYLLIAGTYTPLLWKFVSPDLRWIGLAFVWTAAIAGKLSKLVVQLRVTNFSAQTYLWLGWLPAVFLIRFAPPTCLALIVLGGISYTGGTYFLMRDLHRSYYHAIWHLFVIAGSAFHFCAIYFFVVR